MERIGVEKPSNSAFSTGSSSLEFRNFRQGRESGNALAGCISAAVPSAILANFLRPTTHGYP
jgi:hypothetical protein